MTEQQFRAKMLGYAVGTAGALCEISLQAEDIKIEPEQLRKNVASILSILREVEDFLNEFNESQSR